MKGSFRTGIIFIIAAVIIIVVLTMNEKPELDWKRTYSSRDKIPFGSYILKKSLKDIFPQNEEIVSLDKSLYTYLLEDRQDHKEVDLIYIGEFFDPGTVSIQSLSNFIFEGNDAFIIARNISDTIAREYDFRTTYFSRYDSKIKGSLDTVTHTLIKNNLRAEYPKVDYPAIFTHLDPFNATILGYLEVEGRLYPNFVKFSSPVRGGDLYIHLEPDVFSNYYMLNEETFPIAYEALRHLEGRNILWQEEIYSDEVNHSLRFILSRPALRNAWYILITALVLFLIFKSRREQAAIPIVEPEQNLSIAFAESIGTLYYENGNPADMIEKKIKYFLYNLRKDFRFDEVDILAPEFRKHASQKFQLPQMECDAFFDKLAQYQKIKNPRTAQLKTIQKHIENFKQKIYR